MGLEENYRKALIEKKWFQRAPRRLFRLIDKEFGLRDKIVCDAGCAYGQALKYCGPGSFGLEIDHERVAYARKWKGLTVYQCDLLSESNWLHSMPKAEVVWCSAVIEHVECPITLVRNLMRIAPMVIVYAPTKPWIETRWSRGWRNSSAVSFFTERTLVSTCEKAGLKTVGLRPSWLVRRMFGKCVYVGEH